jgi:adenylate cyclase
VEIERKFLVPEPPPDLGDWPATRLEQGYLAITDDAEVRLRRRGGEDGATLTIKSAPGLSRVEVELPVDAQQFAGLWPLTAGRRLVKTRHTRELAPGVMLELDVYEGDLGGLRTLEVEFADEAAARAFVGGRGGHRGSALREPGPGAGAPSAGIGGRMTAVGCSAPCGGGTTAAPTSVLCACSIRLWPQRQQ